MTCDNILIDGQLIIDTNTTPNTIDVDFAIVIPYSYTSIEGSYEIGIFSGTFSGDVFSDTFSTNSQYIDLIIDVTTNEETCRYVCRLGTDTFINEESGIEEYRSACDASGTELIAGCTDPSALNYNPDAIISDGSCVEKIFGCTDVNAENYNPNANVDDGSCTYAEGEEPTTGGTLITYGCTNSNAINYNPNANFNDGSCIFTSGCTISISNNYNPDAVIDDGSCECDSYNLLISDELNFSGFTISEEVNQDCKYIFSFSTLMKIKCSDFLSYFVNYTDKTILELLEALEINLIFVEGENIVYTTNIWRFSLDTEHLTFYGGDCDTLFDLIRTEANFDCTELLNNLKTYTWLDKQILIQKSLRNKTLKIMFNVKGIPFTNCVLFDDLKLEKFCDTTIERCVFIPSDYGFTLDKKINNDKISLENNKLILNTKQIDVRVNPINYYEQDIIDYSNNIDHLYRIDKIKNLNENKVKTELINPTNFKTKESYFIYDYILHHYNNDEYCPIPSKRIDYDYVNQVYELVNPDWHSFIQQLIPYTTKWNNGHYFYTNTKFHQQKHQYRKYTLEKGCFSGSTLDFEVVTENICLTGLTYKSEYENTLEQNSLCLPCNGVGFGYFDDGVIESGRMIQYYTGDPTTVIDSINYDESENLVDCNTLSGCTNFVIIEDVNFVSGFSYTINYRTNNVNSLNEIKVYVNNILQETVWHSGTEIGIISATLDYGDNEILVNVTNECGVSVDNVIVEICGIEFLSSEVVDVDVSEQGTEFYTTLTFEVYGVDNVNDIFIYKDEVFVGHPTFDEEINVYTITIPESSNKNEFRIEAFTSCEVINYIKESA